MIYEYKCMACKQELEIEHNIKDKPKKKCPLCKKKKLRRMISSNKNSFVLAGSCWEKDGYTTSNNNNKQNK